MATTRYKFLRLEGDQVRSEHGHQVWAVDEWYSSNLAPELCHSGFHCSERMSQAFGYVQGEVVARVEVRGDVDRSFDKESWAEMRLVDVRLWRKEDSVALSVFAAELVIENFERACPNDSRPRDAIRAAKTWLDDPTAENQSAACSAARSAYSAADSAAYSAADSAARSAYSAACSAARSACSAARSAYSAADSAAYSAAYSAADSALTESIASWMEARFETLPVYEATS